jgi:hypothetical protein
MADGPTLKLEGCLVAEWANEAKSLMRSGPVPKGLIVDITDVILVQINSAVLSAFGKKKAESL